MHIRPLFLAPSLRVRVPTQSPVNTREGGSRLQGRNGVLPGAHPSQAGTLISDFPSPER